MIVDDHAIVRKGIRALLSREHEIEVIGEAADGEAAIAQAQSLGPDVILMDLVMPKLDGIGAIKQIVAQQSKARILVLTSFAADDKVFPAIRAGALGYLLKDSSPADLVQAIRQVHLGQPSLDAAIALKVLQELAHPTKVSPAAHTLTEREEEVARLIARGGVGAVDLRVGNARREVLLLLPAGVQAFAEAAQVWQDEIEWIFQPRGDLIPQVMVERVTVQ